MRVRTGLVLFAALLLAPLKPLLGQAAPASPPAAAAPQPGAAPAKPVRPPLVPTSAFTVRSGLSDMELSPDGNKIALRVTPKDGRVHLAVLDAATRKAEHDLAMPPKNQMEWFRWAGNNRLIVSLSQLTQILGEEYRLTRLFVYDLDTKTLTFVGKRDMGITGDDVLFIDPAGQYVLLAMQRTIVDYPSVWRFPLDGTAEKTGKSILPPKRDVWDWYADNKGVVRMGIEYMDSGNLKVHYRKNESESFKVITTIDLRSGKEEEAKKGLWQMLRIVTESDEGMVLEKDDSGHYVLRKFNYAAGKSGETLFAQPGLDVTEAWIDDDNKLIAAFYSDDRDRVVWFDPAYKALQAKLDKALKGSEVWITGRSKDRSRMLVWSGREDDPGAWYVYTAATKRLDLLFELKPALDPALMAKPQPIAYKARDGVEVKGYLTLPAGRDPKNLPLIILPHGGPYGIRDQLYFDTEVQFLANRGYAVLQPNYRGSGGFGEAFEKLGDGQIGRKMQDDLDDAMDWAVAQGVADAKRVCVVGSSYGGYAALWAVIRNPERYRCAASFAGVTDWNAQLRYDRNFFSRESGKKWKQRVSGDQANFNLDTVSPAKQVARLTRPVLLAHGEEDTNVPFKQFKAMRDAAAKEGKPIQVLTFPEEGHGFDKADNETLWLETLEAFLRAHNPPD